MLKQIAKILEHSPKVTIIVTGDKHRVTALLIPELKGDIKMQPILIKNTVVEDADKALEDAIQMVFIDNEEAFSNAAEVAADLKSQLEKKTKATEKSAPAKRKTATPAKEGEETEEADTTDDNDTEEAAATPVPEKKAEPKKAFKPTAAQKKIQVKIKENLERAEKVKDQDMIEFLRKTTVKLLQDNEFPADEVDAITVQFDALLKPFVTEAAEPEQTAKSVPAEPEPVIPTEVEVESEVAPMPEPKAEVAPTPEPVTVTKVAPPAVDDEDEIF